MEAVHINTPLGIAKIEGDEDGLRNRFSKKGLAGLTTDTLWKNNFLSGTVQNLRGHQSY